MKPEYIKLMMMIQTAKPEEKPGFTPHSFREASVRYMTKSGVPDTRPLGIAIPEGAQAPVPVVFVAHYGIDKDTVGQNPFLKQGIAVSGTIGVTPAENGKMTDDDLYFSSACIDCLMEQPDLDGGRLIVMGGSAGGYMTMMLSVIHLGLAASICQSGILNFYFTGRCFLSAINRLNEKAWKKAPEEAKKNFDTLIEYAPFPLHGAVFATCGYSLTDSAAYEGTKGFGVEYSPVFYGDCYSNPVLFLHNTADSLVPVDQVTKRYTYTKNGASIPKTLSFRMADYELPEGVNLSMEDVLPEEQIHMESVCAEAVGAGKKAKVPFHPERKYNFVICNDGCPEAYYGHTSDKACEFDFEDYVACVLHKTPEERYDISNRKLRLMIERFAGISDIFPVFDCHEKGVYGTPAQVQNSVLRELRGFVRETRQKEWLMEKLAEIAEEYSELHRAVSELQERIC